MKWNMFIFGIVQSFVIKSKKKFYLKNGKLKILRFYMYFKLVIHMNKSQIIMIDNIFIL